MIIKPKQKNKGFTLIEMLLSIALFSIVLTISLGAIFTIIDSNRKTQTLTLTMNNLNFAMESMTLDLKTAVPSTLSDSGKELSLTNQDGQQVVYQINNKNKTIEKSVEGGKTGTFSPIISDDVIIETFYFAVVDSDKDDNPSTNGNKQPRTFIFIKGYAEITERIRSEFEVQTTVSPRQLDI
jgi:prepilin-type N-terminal cleavage/methylation domain-containing protein